MNTTLKTERPPTEAEVRALRDRVYGHTSTDRNWNNCKDAWMDPANIRWLQEQDQRTPARLQ